MTTADGGAVHDRVVIVGGGPGGYEAAHVAAQLGAQVTLVDSDGIGGSAAATAAATYVERRREAVGI